MIGIGIDTGGTCTDAVVFDITERCILDIRQITDHSRPSGAGHWKFSGQTAKRTAASGIFSCTVYHTGHQCLRGKQRRPGIHDFYRSQ